MRRLVFGFAIAATALPLAGCYHHVDPARAPTDVQYESSGNYGFLYGLVRPSADRLAQRCGYGVAEQQLSMSGLQAVGTLLTYGLWTPMTARVVCARGPIAIGMTPATIIGMLGQPRVINRTGTANGASEQWVYGNGLYVYFENGLVSAMQDSRRP